MCYLIQSDPPKKTHEDNTDGGNDEDAQVGKKVQESKLHALALIKAVYIYHLVIRIYLMQKYL